MHAERRPLGFQGGVLMIGKAELLRQFVETKNKRRKQFHTDSIATGDGQADAQEVSSHEGHRGEADWGVVGQRGLC